MKAGVGALQRRAACETTADDNLRTLKLVFAAYDSARKAKIITVK